MGQKKDSDTVHRAADTDFGHIDATVIRSLGKVSIHLQTRDGQEINIEASRDQAPRVNGVETLNTGIVNDAILAAKNGGFSKDELTTLAYDAVAAYQTSKNSTNQR